MHDAYCKRSSRLLPLDFSTNSRISTCSSSSSAGRDSDIDANLEKSGEALREVCASALMRSSFCGMYAKRIRSGRRALLDGS
jgi:hypothetical protein